MKTKLWLGCVVVFAGGAVAATGGTHGGHGRNTSVRTHGGPVESCSQIEFEINHMDVARGEEQRNIAKGAVETLVVSPLKNHSVSVTGWDRNEYGITLCKGAAGDTRAEGEQLLRQVRLTIEGGRVSVSGPSSDDWLVYLIVRAPQGANLNLSAYNGPLDVQNVNGRIHAEVVNGPLSFKNCTGDIEGEARNGPVHISGNSGNIRVQTQNGPLDVNLTGSRWEGRLDGSTQNGPLHLSVPEGYLSGVRVEASEHSPVRCRATQCRQAVRTWENPSRIEFGGSPVVRLSTVNGPVSIESADSAGRKEKD